MCHDVREQLSHDAKYTTICNLLVKRQELLCETLVRLTRLLLLALKHLDALKGLESLKSLVDNLDTLKSLDNSNVRASLDSLYAYLNLGADFKSLDIFRHWDFLGRSGNNASSSYVKGELSNSKKQIKELLENWNTFGIKEHQLQYSDRYLNSGNDVLSGFRNTLWSVDVGKMLCYIIEIEKCLIDILESELNEQTRQIKADMCAETIFIILDLGAPIIDHNNDHIKAIFNHKDWNYTDGIRFTVFGELLVGRNLVYK